VCSHTSMDGAALVCGHHPVSMTTVRSWVGGCGELHAESGGVGCENADAQALYLSAGFSDFGGLSYKARRSVGVAWMTCFCGQVGRLNVEEK